MCGQRSGTIAAGTSAGRRRYKPGTSPHGKVAATPARNKSRREGAARRSRTNSAVTQYRGRSPNQTKTQRARTRKPQPKGRTQPQRRLKGAKHHKHKTQAEFVPPTTLHLRLYTCHSYMYIYTLTHLNNTRDQLYPFSCSKGEVGYRVEQKTVTIQTYVCAAPIIIIT